MKGPKHMHERPPPLPTHMRAHTHIRLCLPGQLLAVFHMCGGAPSRDGREKSRGSATVNADHRGEKFIAETHHVARVCVCPRARVCT